MSEFGYVEVGIEDLEALQNKVEDQRAEITDLKNHIKTLIMGGMRNPAIIRRSVGPLEPITITVTKGQIIDAANASKLSQ